MNRALAILASVAALAVATQPATAAGITRPSQDGIGLEAGTGARAGSVANHTEGGTVSVLAEEMTERLHQ